MKSKGFTLGELLIVLALITILTGLSVPAVFYIRRGLRQTELDTKAEMIYMALQNRMMELYTSGNNHLLEQGEILYLKKGTELADQIVTNEVCDASLLRDDVHWIIELVPYTLGENQKDEAGLMAASVKSVLYSEKDVDITDEPDYMFDSYRSKSERLKGGARIGYYGIYVDQTRDDGMAVEEETGGE